MKCREGELEFEFPGSVQCEKLDAPGRALGVGLKPVDFVVEEERILLLIEVKDPSCRPKSSAAAAEEHVKQERVEYVKKIAGKALIHDELVPKVRDSYTYLHLMGRDGKPMVFVFLLGADKLNLDLALLPNFKDRLLARLRQETGQPWVKRYVTDCLVVTEQTWGKVFPRYALRRTA